MVTRSLLQTISSQLSNLSDIILLGLKITALLLILLSGFYRWIEIPGISSSFGLESLARCFQFIVFLGVLISFRQERLRKLGLKLSLFCLTLSLLFPAYFQLVHPAALAQATWLRSQHENLTWLGGDIYTSQEYSRVDEKLRVFVIDNPREVSSIVLPKLNSDLFSLAVISEILDWFGFSKSFLEFYKKGFLFALLGNSLILFLHYSTENSKEKELNQPNFLPSRLSLSIAATITCLTLFIGLRVLTSSYYMNRAEKLTQAGELPKARETLLRAGKLYPPISFASSFVFQLGAFDKVLGNASIERRIHEARELFARGLKKQAITHLDESSELFDSRQPLATTRESQRLLLRAGIDAFNSNKLREAQNLLSRVLTGDPHNLKANYVSQLIALHLSQDERLLSLVEQMKGTYRFMNTRGKKPVLASAQDNLVIMYIRNEELKAAGLAKKKAFK